MARGIEQARTAFETWIGGRGGVILDAVRKPYLTIYRVRCQRNLAEELLRYRDVRTVDLPPRLGIERTLMSTDIQDLDEVPNPADDAPGIAVLDTGLATGHPVLAPAVGDAQSFLAGAAPADEHGHGTFVAGIALYDDVAECLGSGRFIPQFRLYSGRILDERNEGDPSLIETRWKRRPVFS